MQLLFRSVVIAMAGLALSATVATGCSSDIVPLSAIQYTDIYVEPRTFRGDVTCGSSEGTMRTYVVTLFDVSDGTATPLQLPSSPPTKCSLRAAFASVVPGHAYVGAIDAYDLPRCPEPLPANAADDCVLPLGGLGEGGVSIDSGARTMVYPSGAVATPRWTTTCGGAPLPSAPDDTNAGGSAGATGTTGDSGGAAGSIVPAAYVPTTSYALVQVPLGGCIPLRADTTTATVVVHTSSLCAGAGGATTVKATLGGKAVTVPCGMDATFSNLPAGGSTDVSVLGYASGSDTPVWGTTCHATPALGVTTAAVCDPLSTAGALRISGALVSALANGCATYDAALEANPPVTGVACAADATFQSLPAGTYAASVAAHVPGQADVVLACTGAVLPGATATASCTPGG